MKHLVLGGARSGKSHFAEQTASERGKQLRYVATAQARDSEMAARIAHHQHQRDTGWILLEEPVHLATALNSINCSNNCIVIDCLTLWLSNCLEQNCWQQEKLALLSLLPELTADVILVGNEVGTGVVPMGELSRQFVDENGWLHQDLARVCSHVTTVIAGLPLILKKPVES
jgi:adenosylcobinamide kinase/adenosylcobinamide-phosphate guanylyltransferase